ncbi:hypothetical protein BaRGS_00011009 [Batillaria attramentaria]|uniref:Uncharacterized protein n=1 Tax=Batillaria attramentaria TaxID=370345 RepID=A0ABD0LEU6_9CAEN
MACFYDKPGTRVQCVVSVLVPYYGSFTYYRQSETNYTDPQKTSAGTTRSHPTFTSCLNTQPKIRAYHISVGNTNCSSIGQATQSRQPKPHSQPNVHRCSRKHVENRDTTTAVTDSQQAVNQACNFQV